MIPRAHIITLRETSSTMRWYETARHLDQNGVAFEPFYGINGEKWGLATILPYSEDYPGNGFKIGSKTIGISLSHYLLWKMFYSLPDWGDVLWVNEDDVRFCHDWRSRLTACMSSLPVDWDVLYVGSCCCSDKEQERVNGELFVVKYPTCVHSYMVRRKAIETYLDTQQLAWSGIDTQILLRTLPLLKTFTILPRLVDQHNTFIHP